MKQICCVLIVMTFVLSACSANARIGEPTPAPTVAPPVPQVIIVQQPAPVAAQAQDDSSDRIMLAVLIVVLLVAGVTCATVAAYAFGRRHAAQNVQNAVPQSFTLNTHNYYQQLPPRQFVRDEDFQILCDKGYTPEQARYILSGVAGTQIMPPRQ